MTARWLVAVALLALAVPGVSAQTRDSAAFIVRLGTDTVAVERYVRTPDSMVVESVQRSPTTTVHRLIMALGPQGRVTSAEWTAGPPGAAAPSTRRQFTFTADSAFVTTTQAGMSRTARVAATDAVPLSGPFYAPYEMLIARAVTGAPRTDMQLLAGNAVVTIPVERAGADEVTLTNQFGEPMRARVDAQGRMLGLQTPAFTTVERLPWVDLPGLTAAFVERDRTGTGLGMLSVRSTARARVGDANIWIDYWRPAVRGRPVWGALVPWHQVWRLGANDATHFATDRALDMGGLLLEPGTYTLFLLPAPDAWTLIVNRATNIGGLEHDPAHDVGRVTMTTAPAESRAELLTVRVVDDQLEIHWDRTRGTVPLRAR